MTLASPRSRTGFSLVELIIVVVIIGIIGAIAIPRLSRGSQSAADNALKGNLAVMRRAIELYAAEHDNKFPTEADIVDQLLTYTDLSGADSPTKTGAYIFGPYLKEIPPLPVGSRKGGRGIAQADAALVGWIYTGSTGEIKSNTTPLEKDDNNVAYNTY
jgi:prepilin-type N-terminal cleavage/methylation domain-containing protein